LVFFKKRAHLAAGGKNFKTKTGDLAGGYPIGNIEIPGANGSPDANPGGFRMNWERRLERIRYEIGIQSKRQW